MAKKLLSLAVALLMVLAVVPMTGFSAPVKAPEQKKLENPATSTLPRVKAHVCDATLDEALNVPDGGLVFNDDAANPWMVVEEGNRVYAMSNIAGMASTATEISAVVDADEGDIVQFDFKAWGEGSYTFWDHCDFAVDGTVVMTYGAYDNDWETFAYALTAGEHTLVWSYTKDSSVNPTGDYFAIDNVYVGEPVQPDTINVQAVEVPAGRRAAVVYEVLPAEAFNKEVTFAIEDTSIATVSDQGIVTGVAEGTTNVIVTSVADPTVSGTAVVTVTEALPTVNLYGYATYDIGSTYDGQWITFPDYDPSAYMGLGNMPQTWAAAFAGGNVYGYLYENEGADTRFYVMDPETYQVSYTGYSAADGVFAMAYNYANDTMYAICGSDERYLATVNLGTGAITPVGYFTGMSDPMTLAIDEDGVAYTLDLNSSGCTLYTVDLETAACTAVGPTGVGLSYVQSMTYDMDTHQIFWAQILDASTHGLYTIDKNTGAASFLGMIGTAGAEVTCLYTVNDIEIAPIEVEDVTVTFVDGVDGSVIDEYEVPAGSVLDPADFPAAPEHEGLEFVGWNYDGSAIYQDTTITARYRDPNAATATVILNVPEDHWGDGTGYQMLLDADATAFGSIIPETGALTTGGNVPDSVYAEFEYKIPENADGALTTANIVSCASVAIEIPAGVYDWCITNPTPGDRMWIASAQGNVGGRQDNYEFIAGYTYEFVVTLEGSNDAVNVTITEGTAPQPTEPVEPTPAPTEPVTPGEEELVAGYYFEAGSNAENFTFVDKDNDGFNWEWQEDMSITPYCSPYEGEGLIHSASYDNDTYTALTPDNWAISPAIELPEGTARVTLYAAGQDSGGYHLEHFAIYAGLTADPDEMMQISEIFVTAHDYAQFEADLSDFAGETVYIAIRHFDVTDMFILDVDQVEVWATPGEPQPPVEHLWGDANGDGEVNGEDVLLVMRYSMEIQELDPENIDPWCDVNQDGVCDMTDALLIARYVSEIIPELPVQG